MNINQIVEAIGGRFGNEGLTINSAVKHAFASDLMSDVLTLNVSQVVLITGLVNIQTIRTAEMAEIQVIIFARGKKPTADMLELACRENICLIESAKSMYHISGLLFSCGLKPVY